MDTIRWLVSWLRYWCLMLWRPARIREGDRLIRQLGDALANAPSKHDNPEYQQRFLRALFDGTYRREDFH